ncbi:MAG: AAA family ATPase [Candidatus Pacearchaeota archaeon]|jgi:adenylate kinase family enzyme
MKRIRIIGTPGSGKSYLAELISRKLKIRVYDLDDLYWYKKYSKKRSPKKLRELIKNITNKKSWIIEGMQYGVDSEWIIKKSELVIWVNPSLHKIIFRLILRHKNRKNEKLSGTLKLIKSVIKYKLNINSKHKKAHNSYFQKYSHKFIVIKNNKGIEKFLGILK